MQTNASKTDRWIDAAQAARTAYDDLSAAVEELVAVQPEIEESYENMGQGLQQTERGLLYEAITGVDLGQINNLMCDLESIIADAEVIG